jgi:hypothetical protein
MEGLLSHKQMFFIYQFTTYFNLDRPSSGDSTKQHGITFQKIVVFSTVVKKWQGKIIYGCVQSYICSVVGFATVIFYLQ